MTERIETVEGKTFEEWEREFSEYMTPRQARELAAVTMGWEVDTVAVDDNGQPVNTEGMQPSGEGNLQ